MIDFATSVKSYQRVIHQPPAGRPRWINEGGPINELQYLSWGWREYGRHAIPVSFHEGWTYQFMARGRSFMDTGEKLIPVPQGHLIIVGPSCPNGWSAARPEERCQILTWIWRDNPLLPSINPGENGWRIFPMSPTEEKQLRLLHEETRGELARMDEAATTAIHSIRSRMDVILARSQSRHAAESNLQVRVEYALGWLGQHPEELRPVTALADYLQISPATLNRLFQRQLGQNVREVAYTMRMETARRLLEKEHLPVKEVAFRLGYSHANDFTRAYSRFWSASPTGRKVV